MRLRLYDSTKQLTLQCDVSEGGFEAALLQHIAPRIAEAESPSITSPTSGESTNSAIKRYLQPSGKWRAILQIRHTGHRHKWQWTTVHFWEVQSLGKRMEYKAQDQQRSTDKQTGKPSRPRRQRRRCCAKREKAEKFHTSPFAHRNTASEGSPAQRDSWDGTPRPTTTRSLKPPGVDPVKAKRHSTQTQNTQRHYYNRRGENLAHLAERDVVRMPPFTRCKRKWDKAVVTHRLEKRSYEVETDCGSYRRNQVHLKKTGERLRRDSWRHSTSWRLRRATPSYWPILTSQTDGTQSTTSIGATTVRCQRLKGTRRAPA